MRALAALIVILNLLACVANLPSDDAHTRMPTADQKAPPNRQDATEPTQPLKSPHGYIINKDYDLGRFGGFIGDCTDDQNWPYYWQCMSENSGNGGFN